MKDLYGTTLKLTGHYAFGNIARRGIQFLMVPFVTAAIPTADYGAVGMAAVMSGVTHAPMSSIVIVFELSGSYSLILPLLLAAVISTLVSDVMRQESIYNVMLSRTNSSTCSASWRR